MYNYQPGNDIQGGPGSLPNQPPNPANNPAANPGYDAMQAWYGGQGGYPSQPAGAGGYQAPAAPVNTVVGAGGYQAPAASSGAGGTGGIQARSAGSGTASAFVGSNFTPYNMPTSNQQSWAEYGQGAKPGATNQYGGYKPQQPLPSYTAPTYTPNNATAQYGYNYQNPNTSFDSGQYRNIMDTQGQYLQGASNQILQNAMDTAGRNQSKMGMGGMGTSWANALAAREAGSQIPGLIAQQLTPSLNYYQGMQGQQAQNAATSAGLELQRGGLNLQDVTNQRQMGLSYDQMKSQDAMNAANYGLEAYKADVAQGMQQAELQAKYGQQAYEFQQNLLENQAQFGFGATSRRQEFNATLSAQQQINEFNQQQEWLRAQEQSRMTQLEIDMKREQAAAELQMFQGMGGGATTINQSF